MKSRVYGVLCAIICTALPSISSALTRDEIIATAEGYVNHVWTATSNNVCHGIQSDNLNVDTPGWVITSQPNKSVPYKWGGFDTLAIFDVGLRNNRCAGDTATSKGGGSNTAVGVDCSGFVTRAWGVPYPTKFSTRTLPGITRLLNVKYKIILDTFSAGL